MYQTCAILVIIGIIIGLAMSLDHFETLPALPEPSNKTVTIPMIKKLNIASRIKTQNTTCSALCDPNGHCQSEEFYKCVHREKDVNYGLSGRQRSAFGLNNVRVFADTTEY